jgi:hypothetical protein
VSEYQWGEDKQKIFDQVQSATPDEVLYAIKWVIALRKIKVMQVVAGNDTGKWTKTPVDAVEKLVRIQSAILTLPAELREAVLAEAENRIQCVAVQADILKAPPRKPWE